MTKAANFNWRGTVFKRADAEEALKGLGFRRKLDELTTPQASDLYQALLHRGAKSWKARTKRTISITPHGDGCDDHGMYF